MPDVVGIRFKRCGKIYDFEVDGIDADPGIKVVVESEMGLSLGVVAVARHSVGQPDQKLKKVLRIANDADLDAEQNNRLLEEEAKGFCIERVKSRELPMKIVGTRSTLDRKRIVFYFSAEGRIDFRELVRDLAAKFKTRIEMRQIGVRDEVKLIGGIGVCGKEVCCKSFLTTFEPVSIRMAKKQELVLNPGKLSGICGRLMCCLGFEIDEPAGGGPGREKGGRRTGPERGRKPRKAKERIARQKPDRKATDTRQEGRSEAVKTADSRPAPQTAPPQKNDRSPQEQRQKGPDEARKPDGKPFSRRKKFWRKKKRK